MCCDRNSVVKSSSPAKVRLRLLHVTNSTIVRHQHHSLARTTRVGCVVSRMEIRIQVRASRGDHHPPVGTALDTNTPRPVKHQEVLICFFNIHAFEFTGAP